MSINVRTKKFNNKDGSTREYLYLVENYREDGKKKQRNIACIGRTDDLNDKNQIDKIIEALQKYSKELVVLKSRDEISAEWTKTYGPLPIFRHIWEKLGLAKIFAECASEYNYQYDPSEVIFSMVCNHLMDPRSERGTNSWKESVYEPLWDGFDLHHYYRALDFLIKHKRDMEIDIMNRVINLFNQKLDLVMFDTTTIMHWGEGEEADILQHGFSKDKRSDLRQIMVGLLMTKDGYPIGHEVFSGNLGDIKAFREILDKLKHRYSLGRLIMVCDRGMISKKNLEYLEELDFEYIIGVRMRKLKKEVRDKLLSVEEMDEIIKGKLLVKEEKLDGRRYIVCHNPEEAIKERIKRDYFHKILEKKVYTRSTKDWIVKNGYRKYITIENAEINIDEEKFKQESQFDGTWILMTNSGLSSEELSGYYKDLHQIECCFRELKTNIELGPLYHRKEERIRSHVFVCFLSLLIKIYFSKAIKAQDSKVLYCDIMDKLNQVRVMKLNLGSTETILRSELPEGAYIAYQALNIKPSNRFFLYTDRTERIYLSH